MSRLDDEIDQLYRLPLSEFTSERNALARRAGAQGAEIRTLQKPSMAAWALNQLYWENRPIYQELIERAEDLRATHAAAMRGRRTDLRGASRAHEEALESALKATLALLEAKGQPATDATRQAIATTLRSLPGDERAGRLTRQLQPRGFEMLAGAAQGRVLAPQTAAKSKSASRPADKPDKAGREAAARLVARQEAVTGAARAAREAEHLVRREEFELARASREMEKSEQRVKEAEEALRQAQVELAEARRAAASSAKARDAAQARAHKAAEQLAEARRREERARAELTALS